MKIFTQLEISTLKPAIHYRLTDSKSNQTEARFKGSRFNLLMMLC